MISSLDMLDCFFEIPKYKFASYTINNDINLFIIKYETHFTFFFSFNFISVNCDEIKTKHLCSYRVGFERDSGIINDINILERIDEYITYLNKEFLNKQLNKKLSTKNTKEKTNKI